MKTATIVLLSLLAAVLPRAAAADSSPAGGPWRAEVEAGMRALASGPGEARVSEAALGLALEAAVREIGARSSEEAAQFAYEAAVRAELRMRLGEAMPRVRAELRQEFRIAARAGDEAAERLRALERIRRRFERALAGAEEKSGPWWMGSGYPRGRWGS